MHDQAAGSKKVMFKVSVLSNSQKIYYYGTGSVYLQNHQKKHTKTEAITQEIMFVITN